MNTLSNLDHNYFDQAVARIYDVGVRGRVAFLYVDQTFRLVSMNQTVAQELMTLEACQFQGGRFRLCDRFINKRLQKLIDDVLSVEDDNLMQVGGYLKVPAKSRESILLSVFPFCQPAPTENKDNDSSERFAEIRISYPKQTNLLMFSRAMRDLYELSASESKVVSLLVQGCNTKEIANTLEVAESTLRTHLKRIFSKTETRHQAELVSKILQYDSYVMPDSFAS